MPTRNVLYDYQHAEGADGWVFPGIISLGFLAFCVPAIFRQSWICLIFCILMAIATAFQAVLSFLTKRRSVSFVITAQSLSWSDSKTGTKSNIDIEKIESLRFISGLLPQVKCFLQDGSESENIAQCVPADRSMALRQIVTAIWTVKPSVQVHFFGHRISKIEELPKRYIVS